MIDHISVGVSDLERSARFYEATLAPLDLARLVTRPETVGFGKAYLASDRRIAFNEDGIFRHYKELDI